MELANFLAPISEDDLREVYEIDVAKVNVCLATLRNNATNVKFSEITERTNDGNRMMYSVHF